LRTREGRPIRKKDGGLGLYDIQRLQNGNAPSPNHRKNKPPMGSKLQKQTPQTNPTAGRKKSKKKNQKKKRPPPKSKKKKKHKNNDAPTPTKPKTRQKPLAHTIGMKRAKILPSCHVCPSKQKTCQKNLTNSIQI